MQKPKHRTPKCQITQDRDASKIRTLPKELCEEREKVSFCTSDLHNFWASKLHAHLVCGPYANELRRYCHSAVPLQPPAASTQDAGRRTRAGPQDSGVRACRHAVNKAPSTVPVINPCLCGISLFPSHFHFRLHPSSFWQFRNASFLMQMRVHPRPSLYIRQVKILCKFPWL